MAGPPSPRKPELRPVMWEIIQRNLRDRRLRNWMSEEEYVEMLDKTHVLVVSPRACRAVGQAIYDFPERVAINGQFALIPFDRLWLEFDPRELRYCEDLSSPIDEQVDRIAFYFMEGIATVFFRSGPSTSNWGWAYQLHYEGKRQPIDTGAEKLADEFFWGRMYKWVPDGLQGSLRNSHTMWQVPVPAYEER